MVAKCGLKVYDFNSTVRSVRKLTSVRIKVFKEMLTEATDKYFQGPGFFYR